MTREQTVPVELLEQLRAGACEKDLDCIFFSTQNGAELRGRRADELCLRQMAWVLFDEGPTSRGRVIGSVIKTRGRTIGRPVALQQTAAFQLSRELLENRTH